MLCYGYGYVGNGKKEGRKESQEKTLEWEAREASVIDIHTIESPWRWTGAQARDPRRLGKREGGMSAG